MNGATIPLSVHRLIIAGISDNEAYALRRISMSLRRWFELECNGGIARANPKPPALKSLIEIMANYPTLTFYVQTDPRGTALYIIRAGDIPAGKDPDAYYSNGIGVHK